MNSQIKNIFVYVLKFILGVGIVFFLINKINFSSFYAEIQNISIFSLISVVILSIFNLIIQFMRFKSACSLLNNLFKYKQIWSAFFAGFTLKFLVPGGYGDLGKMIFIDDNAKNRINVFILEKLSTMLLSLFLGSIAIACFFQYYYILFLSLLPLSFYYFSDRVKKIKLLKKFIIKDVNFKKKIAIYIFYTIIVYFLISLQYWVLSQNSFSSEIFKQVGLFFVMVVILLATSLLPITIAGLGVRESVGFYLFPLIGLTEQSGVAIPLVTFLINSGIPAIIGLFFILKSPKFMLKKY